MWGAAFRFGNRVFWVVPCGVQTSIQEPSFGHGTVFLWRCKPNSERWWQRYSMVRVVSFFVVAGRLILWLCSFRLPFSVGNAEIEFFDHGIKFLWSRTVADSYPEIPTTAQAAINEMDRFAWVTGGDVSLSYKRTIDSGGSEAVYEV